MTDSFRNRRKNSLSPNRRARRRARRTAVKRRLRRPTFESLEERTLLAVFSPGNFADEVDADTSSSDLSLREAIIAANQNGEDDTIQLGVGTYALSIANSAGQENAAAQGDLDLTEAGKKITIQGVSSSFTTIDAGTIDRVFQIVGNAEVVLRNLKITGGLAQDDGTATHQPGDSHAWGGGILNSGGQLTLEYVTIANNEARGGDGTSGGEAGDNALGGAIYVGGAGTLSLNQTHVTDNSATGGDGADDATSGGNGGDATGGAIYAGGGANVTLNQSSVRRNEAIAGDGGNAAGAGHGGSAQGGGIHVDHGTLALTLTPLEDNSATGGSGGDGTSGGNGGSAQGGAIYADGSGGATNVMLNLSRANRNTATGGAAGMGTGGEGGGAYGGAIHIGSGTLNLTNSPLSDNSASGGVGGGGDAKGGAIYAGGPVGSANVSVNTSGLSRNSATGGDGSDGASSNGGNAQGGALFLGNGTANVFISTISTNSATGGNGGGTASAAGGDGGSAMGGAIYAGTVGSAAVSIDRSMSLSNTATGGDGAAGGNGGDAAGGAFNIGNGTLELFLSPVVSNRAVAGKGGNGTSGGGIGGNGGNATGGGIHAGDLGSVAAVTLNISSVVSNSATGGNGGSGGAGNSPGGDGGDGGNARGGGVFINCGSTLTQMSSIVASNTVTAGSGGSGGVGTPNGANGASGVAEGPNIFIAVCSPTIDLDPDNSEGNQPNFAATFDEGDGPLAIADSDAAVTDPDDTELESMQLAVSGAVDLAEEELTIGGTAFDLQTTAATAVTGGFDVAIADNTGGSFTVDITVTGGGTAPIGDFETLLRGITYQHTDGDDPTGGARTAGITVDDGTFTSTAVTSTITVNPINDAPTLTLDDDDSGGSAPDFAATFSTTVGTPVNITDTDLAIADDDNATVASATVTITNPQDGADEVLAATPSGAIGGGDISFAGGVLSITAVASLADYEAVLSSVTYDNNAASPTLSPDRIINFVVNDGTDDSATVTSTVTLAAGPLLDLDADDSTAAGNDFAGAFVEDGGGVAVVDTDVTISSTTTPNINQAVITLTNAQDGAAETLFVQGGAGALPAGISLAGDNSAMITLSGDDTSANYETALGLIRYNNSDDTPTTSPDRTVTVTVRDDNNDTSPAATATISVTATNDAPTPQNQSYDATGNVPIDVPAGSGLLSGASDPEGDTPSVDSVDSTSANGGTISGVNFTTGAFTYTPPAGFTGTDTFDFTLTDDGAGSPVSAPATVTVTVSDMIWFVDNSASNGDGTLNSPFNSLSGATELNGSGGSGDLDDDDDVIFVLDGGSDYDVGGSSGLVLENNQALIGEGVSGTTLEDYLSTNLSITVAANSQTLPSINGTSPAIVNSSGDAVTLATDNLIAGVDFGNTTNSSHAVTGNFGTLSISEVGISGTGGIFDLTNGTIQAVGGGAATFASLSGSGSVDGINLDNVAGTLTVTGSTTYAGTGSAEGINIDTGASGAFTANLQGGLDIDTVQGIGVDLDGADNNLTFNVTDSGAISTTIDTTDGEAIDADGDADNALTFGATLDSVSSSSSSTQGIELDFIAGTLTINGGSITGASGRALEIGTNTNNSGGNAAVTYAGSINNTAGEAVFISELSGGSVTLSGNISHNAAGSGIDVQNINNGTPATVTFSGSDIDITSTGSHNGIDLATNGDGTISFTGGDLDVTTASGIGLNATGGGTISVTGNGNSVTTTGATAAGVNINGTTLGASGVTFGSVSVASGATNGIVLNSTGSMGGFTVSGDGSTSNRTLPDGTTEIVLDRDASGGTITGTTGISVSLTNAFNVTLRQMDILTAGADAINSSGGGDFTFAAVKVDNPTGDGWDAANLTGTNRVNNGSLFEDIDTADTSAIEVANTNTNLTLLEIENSTFQNSSTLDSNILFESFGTSNMNLSVFGSEFRDNAAQAVTSAAGQSASSTGVVETRIGGASTGDGNLFINTNDASTNGFENNVGVLVTNGATQRALIQANEFDNVGRDGTIANTSIIRTQNNGGTFIGEVRDNELHNFNFVATGGGAGGGRHGIGHIAEVPDGGGTGNTSLIIDNNDIDDLTDREGIFISFRRNIDGTSDSDVTISNNRIGVNGNIGGGGGNSDQEGIEFETRNDNGSAYTVNLLFEGNTLTPNTDDPALFVEAKDDTTIDATIRNNSTANSGEFTNQGSGEEIELESEDSGSTLNGSISANTLNAGAGVILLDGGSGTLNIEQASLNAIASSNGIPNGNVMTAGGGVDTFSAAAPTLPSHPAFLTALDSNVSVSTSPDGVLSQGQLDFIVDAAVARWAETGLTAEQLAALEAVSFTVSDLPGWFLGSFQDGSITLDSDAAGYGWFVDSTPGDEVEFQSAGAEGEGHDEQLVAGVPSAAFGRLDLLTVVMHELGHVLGYPDLPVSEAPHDLMTSHLTTGTRRLPAGEPAHAEHNHSSGETEYLLAAPTVSPAAARGPVDSPSRLPLLASLAAEFDASPRPETGRLDTHAAVAEARPAEPQASSTSGAVRPVVDDASERDLFSTGDDPWDAEIAVEDDDWDRALAELVGSESGLLSAEFDLFGTF